MSTDQRPEHMERQVYTPEEAIAILRGRAEFLARPPQDVLEREAGSLVVEFLLADETYVLDASYVNEITTVREIAPLPGTPDFVLGIFNLRGEIHSAIDLRVLFNLKKANSIDSCFIILIRNQKMEFGIIAEQINGMQNIKHDELQDSLPALTGIRSNFLKGVSDSGKIYLDANKMLNDKQLCNVAK